MKRRALLTALLLAGCGLSERPYAERREWPLRVTRPDALPPRPRGAVLLVRAIRAAPGLGSRGLQTVLADGSIQTAFYEEWAVAPAEGVEDSLRRWLAASGLYAAVVAQGSRLETDLVLEGELQALWVDVRRGLARAAVAVTVIYQSHGGARIMLQRSFTAEAPCANDQAPTMAAAQLAALADVFGQIEAALRERG